MGNVLYLKCKASKGQFSDEVAIRGKDFTGEDFSFFVNRDFVQTTDDPESGEVNACLSVIPIDSNAGLVLIRLPGQTFGNGSTITVREDDLTSPISPQGAGHRCAGRRTEGDKARKDTAPAQAQRGCCRHRPSGRRGHGPATLLPCMI